MVHVRSWTRTLDEMWIWEIGLRGRLPLMDWRRAIWMVRVMWGRIPQLGWKVQFTDGAG